MILKFPGEPAASLELAHRPGGGRVDVGSGFDHLAIQVDSLTTTLERLTDGGLEPEPIQHPGGPQGPMTSWLTETQTVTGSSWCNGRPDTPTASPKQTSPDAIDAPGVVLRNPRRMPMDNPFSSRDDRGPAHATTVSAVAVT